MGSTVTNSAGEAGDQAVYFTAGHYDLSDRPALWVEGERSPVVMLELGAFRAMFDAVGETSIGTAGNIAPTVLRDLLDALPWKRTSTEGRMRWLAALAESRGERIGWSTTEPDVAEG